MFRKRKTMIWIFPKVRKIGMLWFFKKHFSEQM